MIDDAERKMVEAMQGILKKFGVELSEGIIKTQDGLEIADYSEVIGKTQERLDLLEEESELFHQKTGMTQEEILEFGSNPDNFSPEEWQAIQNVKKACDEYKKEIRENLGGEDMSYERLEEESQKPKKLKKRTKRTGKSDWLSL